MLTSAMELIISFVLLLCTLSLFKTAAAAFAETTSRSRHHNELLVLRSFLAPRHHDADSNMNIADSQQRRDILLKTLAVLSVSSSTPPVPAAENQEILGPLSPLIGTWAGKEGINIVAVPSRRSKPNQEGRFELMVRPYREILTFSSIQDAVRNRGGDVDQYVGAISYEQTVISTDSVEEVIHVENGMLFYLDNVIDYETRERRNEDSFAVARTASIPHGNSAMLLGTVETFSGPPVFPSIQTIPQDIGPRAPKEYLNPYRNVINPQEHLQNALDKQSVVQTTHISLDSNNRGASVSSVPFLTDRANTSRFCSDFWLETLEDGTQQLQYSQVMSLEFHKQIGGDDRLIMWPHVTINTLTKEQQSD
jgi:hypothetical protein